MLGQPVGTVQRADAIASNDEKHTTLALRARLQHVLLRFQLGNGFIQGCVACNSGDDGPILGSRQDRILAIRQGLRHPQPRARAAVRISPDLARGQPLLQPGVRGTHDHGRRLGIFGRGRVTIHQQQGHRHEEADAQTSQNTHDDLHLGMREE